MSMESQIWLRGFPREVALGSRYYHRDLSRLKVRSSGEHRDRQKAGARYRTELYTGALHGFTMSDLPVYSKAVCDQHWDRLLTLYGWTLTVA